MYHATTSAVSRGSGGSACAKSAYIGGQEITNEITGEIHNYTKNKALNIQRLFYQMALKKLSHHLSYGIKQNYQKTAKMHG